MDTRRRLYPTLKEEREMDELKKRFGLPDTKVFRVDSARINKSRQKVRTKECNRPD